MYYILYSDKTVNVMPEVSYMNGTTISVKRGWFMIDSKDTSTQFGDGVDYIRVDGDRYPKNKNMIFNNKIKAEIILLNLRINDYKKSSMDFYFPKQVEQLKNELKSLIDEYPEYVI